MFHLAIAGVVFIVATIKNEKRVGPNKDAENLTIRPAIQMPTVEEDRAITAAAKLDPDALPLTAKQLKAMVPMASLRGRPKSENKKLLVSIRYSPEVVEYLKSTGEGWQSRRDGVLRKYVERHTHRPAD